MAGALNALLWLYMGVHPGVTGKVEVDAPKYFIWGCLAAAVTWPSITVLRVGNLWQRLLALLFLALPCWTLFMIGEWAVSHW